MAEALKKADILDETVTSLGWDMRLGLCFAVSTFVLWSKLREIAQSFSMHSDLYTVYPKDSQCGMDDQNSYMG